MKKSKNNINTGQLIANFISVKKISKTELGLAINRKGLSILAYIRNSSIQTGILIDICHATKHNFFRDIADQLPDDFTRTKAEDNTLINEKDLIIAQLREEVKVLTIQNEVLMRVKGS